MLYQRRTIERIGALGMNEYLVELARAWRAYPGKHILSFYAFAVIFKAGWDAKQ
jgi:hypothetical protein